MQHLVREARYDDAGAISRLITTLGYEMCADEVAGRLVECAGRADKVLVAEQDENVIGFLSFHAIPLFHQSGRLGRITAMAIDPLNHRQGVGRSLVRAAEKAARDCGCGRMEVTSGDHREQDAHLFYQAEGYRMDCRRFIKNLEPEE